MGEEDATANESLNRPILFSKCATSEDCMRALDAAARIKEATPFLFLADGTVFAEKRDSNVEEYENMFGVSVGSTNGALRELAATKSPPFLIIWSAEDMLDVRA